jgi:D-alanyl-D-alanine carboxypeptidase
LKEYGEEYVKKYVAVPGYSEHHTGLALDLFLIIDGKGVYLNEDMVQYPEIWDKIHAKLADHGFILRYLPEKKIETGYSYEPWHIRYIGDVDAAHEIMDKGITYERYLGELDPMIADCTVDYGSSKLYAESDIDGAIDSILAEFSTWEGCTLKSLAFTDDATCEKELESANKLRDEGTEEFTQALVLTSAFHTPSAEQVEGTAWEPDTDYEDWTWLLARRSSEDSWELLTWGLG